jgi:hypothetical protein
MTNFGCRSDFKPLKSVNSQISADREFSIEIGSVANWKIKNLQIVNTNTNYIDFISILIPAVFQLSSLKWDWWPMEQHIFDTNAGKQLS